MNRLPAQITLDEWDDRYTELVRCGLREAFYGGPLRRHVADGNVRLQRLRFDNSPAALRLWNFLLTEDDRLHRARREGRKIIGAMKDLGTVPIMAYSLPDAVAFYLDGAWWTPCLMELNDGLFQVADSLGIDESFCPVRAVVGALIAGGHFPRPDVLVCSAGATCDDLSAIAQRLHGLGIPIMWWEMPARRLPDADEPRVALPGGFRAPQEQVDLVRSELERVRREFERLSAAKLDDEALAAGIEKANEVRGILAELRKVVFTAKRCPLPALEMLIAEMLAIHYCSDREETIHVLMDLLDEVRTRVKANAGILPEDAVRVFWVNPVADVRAMNLIEEYGGRVCGTEHLFSHALDEIPQDIPPMEALARTALADPMAGPSADRAERICRDIRLYGAEAVIISRIPGASHYAFEGETIREAVQANLGIPVAEMEVPPLSDLLQSALSTRMEALIEVVKQRRKA